MLSFDEARLAARMGNAVRRQAWPAGDYVTAQNSLLSAPVRDGELITDWLPDEDDQQATDYEVA